MQIKSKENPDHSGVIYRGRKPGDIGHIIYRHGVLYAQEYGFDETFDLYVGKPLIAFAENFDPTKLDGVPYHLQEPLRRAEAQGTEALGEWLEAYGNQIQDPRKAWLQLDYCTLVARDDPQEARRIFQQVRQRVDEDSPVYPRLMQLRNTFE